MISLLCWGCNHTFSSALLSKSNGFLWKIRSSLFPCSVRQGSSCPRFVRTCCYPFMLTWLFPTARVFLHHGIRSDKFSCNQRPAQVTAAIMMLMSVTLLFNLPVEAFVVTIYDCMNFSSNDQDFVAAADCRAFLVQNFITMNLNYFVL